jgi:hypothetical protein
VSSNQYPTTMTFRSNVTRRAAAYIATLFLILIGMGIADFAGAYSLSHTFQGNVAGTLFIAVGLLGFGWSTLRLARMGVFVTKDGVLIRNWLRSTRLRWPDIASFQFGDEIKDLSLRESLNTPSLQPYAVMRTGKHIALVGLSSTRVKSKESRNQVQRLLDSLNGELGKHTV